MSFSRADSSVDQATRFMELGEFDQAQAVLDVLLKDDPGFIAALRLAAMIACLRGRNEITIELMDRVLLAQSDDVEALIVRGGACNATGDFSGAEVNLRHALSLNPRRHDAHFNLAMTFWETGDHSQAAEFFKNVLALEGQSFLPNYYLGRIFEGFEDFAAAEQYFRQAVELNPDSAESRSRLGKILLARGSISEALANFEGVVSIEPGDSAHWLLAARAAFELAHENRAWANLEAYAAHQGEQVNEVASRWERATLHDLEAWCNGRRQDVVRIARLQNHKFGSVKVLPRPSGPLDEPAAVTPEVFVAKLNECRVLPLDHLLVSSDRMVFIAAVMSRPMHCSYTSPHITQACDDGRVLLDHPRTSTRIDLPCAYLGAAESYCDWIQECVTRLWAYQQRAEWEKLPVLVHADITPWQKSLLELLGYDESRWVRLARDSVAIFSELFVASLSAPVNVVAPFAIEHLRRNLRKAIPRSSDTPRRIFLSRQGMLSRRIANFPEIARILERHDFYFLPADATSVRDVFQMIGSAEVIVGLDGAAMANVFFAPANAKVALVTANAIQALRYSASSRAIGHEFTYLLGDAAFETSDHLSECDIRLDPRILEEYLSAL